MTEPEDSSAKVEHKYHDYSGNRIPWYVRLIWILFWCFVIFYTIRYLVPELQIELFRAQ